MTDMKKINLMGLIGLIGVIILIVGVFLNWVDFSIESIVLDKTWSITGWDIFGNEDYSELFEYSYAPVIALACGIIALITTILPIVYNNEKINKLLGIITLILAVVAIVIGFLFYGSVSDSMSVPSIGTATAGVAIGFWLCIVGAVITALGGILDIMKKDN